VASFTETIVAAPAGDHFLGPAPRFFASMVSMSIASYRSDVPQSDGIESGETLEHAAVQLS